MRHTHATNSSTDSHDDDNAGDPANPGAPRTEPGAGITRPESPGSSKAHTRQIRNEIPRGGSPFARIVVVM